mgnify:CR=1 FL=1
MTKKKVVKHPNKVGKVGPKKKEEGEKKVVIRLSKQKKFIEQLGGLENVTAKLDIYFDSLLK